MSKRDYSGTGYQNPLGASAPSWAGASTFNPPSSLSDFSSWKKDTDLKVIGSGIDWKQQPGVDNSGMWEKSFGQYSDPEQRYLNQTKKNLFDKTKRKRDDENSSSSFGGFGATIGKNIEGGGSEAFTGFYIDRAPQHAPVVVQGTPGQKGLFSQIAGIAAPVVGMMGGPVAPFISAGLSGIGETGW